MTHAFRQEALNPAAPLFAGRSGMGARIQEFDWSKTPIGAMDRWPLSLKTAVSIVLGSRYPMFVWWGPELINLYNDAYASILGMRHPAALGRPAAVVWSEVWPVLGPQAAIVLRENRATWNEEVLLVMERNGYAEETYFTWSYSPVRTDDGAVGGLFCACTEDTQKILSRRRLRTLRELGTQGVAATTAEEAAQLAAKALSTNGFDLPFTLLYLTQADGQEARLAGITGLSAGLPASPEVIRLNLDPRPRGQWPLSSSLTSGKSHLLTDLPEHFGTLNAGPWPEAVRSAMVLPIRQSGQEIPTGFLIAGISPRRQFDDDYRGFLELLAGQVATAVSNAIAFESERHRAEALAELDRAKTMFFSNISHEFRTPLTLMLGPLEEELRKRSSARGNLEIIHRNSLRLLKLVNALLDFSRIEAGRMKASYEPTDLAAYTAELASAFRTAIERAGLRLIVKCPSLPELIYVDREMWEKVVLNLLSNAFKFTFEGEIQVSLHWAGERVELSVADTGVGIPQTELPKIFERFHRVRASRSRTHEGTGIGLALVQELVALHGGRVEVESAENRGTTFRVSLPTGKRHLLSEDLSPPRDQKSVRLGPAPYVEEALWWLPDVKTASPAPAGQPAIPGDPSAVSKPRILLAEDNSDMRNYVSRLLSPSYTVEAVADGKAALDAIQADPPDLILSDIMMPILDGFGLLQKVRKDERTQTVPFILLSARAGEEARVEGVAAGADDYLTKPFSARELLARVRTHLQLSSLRREARAVLERQNQELESRVAERTAKLTEMVGELQHISYAIVHDMRAPLRAMSGFSEALLEECTGGATPLSSQAQEYSRRILRSAQRLDKLITDALSYTKAVLLDLPLQPVEVTAVIREILDTYPNLHRDKAEIRIEGELPTVIGNETLLTQCFANLLGNAVKFVAPGVHPQVRISATITDRSARIFIQDNGIGIPSDSHYRLFGMFQKLDTQYEGTGIGLAIVRKVVERMGGKVGANSESESGSCFWVELCRP